MQTDALWQIPDPDYDRHPAYGAQFGAPSLGAKLRSLWQLAPYLLGYAVYDLIGRPGRRPRLAAAAIDSPVLGALVRDGVVALRFAPDERRAVHAALAPYVAALRGKMAGERTALDQQRVEVAALLATLRRSGLFSAVFRYFNPRSIANELFIHEDQAPEVFEALRAAFARHGVLAAASRYQGRSLDIKYIKMLIHHGHNRLWQAPFADLGLPDPRSLSMHVDHLWTTKTILYLSEVGERSGPFCYCRGSNDLRIGWLEGAARRANDRVDFSSCRPERRRLFQALPKRLRRKAKFGNDLPDDHPELQRLLAAEHRYTSADADLILFDDRGIHRGGLTEEGERVMLQIRLG